FQLKIGDLIDSEIMQLIPLQFAKTLVESLLNPDEEVAATAVEEKPTAPKKESHVRPEPINQASTSSPRQEEGRQHIGTNINEQSTVQSVACSDFEPVDLPENNKRNLDLLLDIPQNVTVELGRTKNRIEDILDLV